ncbi:glycerophosphodiester phosphodiesterase family protein [Tritonibacter mobilis]|uniref:glycerophosphodiester phosphodiesterase family protein n=1 Tax=Tritonibacter mobilis TaxID=379347 RepID=UPI000806E7A3|nr:glycerophosphodiester phosphodiesterase family protein [Tritonibacter mobilis]
MSGPRRPAAFLQRPITHRALHGLREKCPESSRAAVRAAVKVGHGIEIDMQLSADGRAMVFHDDALRDLPDFERVGASFISHEASDVTREPVQSLRHDGLPVRSWTLRSPEQEAEVAALVDNVTFENYLSAFGA